MALTAGHEDDRVVRRAPLPVYAAAQPLATRDHPRLLLCAQGQMVALIVQEVERVDALLQWRMNRWGKCGWLVHRLRCSHASRYCTHPNRLAPWR